MSEHDSPNPPEAAYIAIVQTSGLVTPTSVESRAFATHLEAVTWVRSVVEEAHGEVALTVPTFASVAYDFGGEPVKYNHWMWVIVSPGGPVWGVVHELDEVTDRNSQ